jgi:hypothetical protein
MTLASPGTEITITDEAQYLSATVGTVPLVLIATAQDKLFNGAAATYTSKANAGQLLSVTSQRDIVTNLGYPIFQQSAAGTPLHANELNEYGLMAAYSAMASCNLMYLIRADIDLNEIAGTSVRPIGSPADGTHWLDLGNSSWGVYEWNAATQSFVNKVPLTITSATDTVQLGNGLVAPAANIGQIGDYALVANSPFNLLYEKRSDNTWNQVGSTAWQQTYPAVMGGVSNPVFQNNSQLTINGVTVTLTNASPTVSLDVAVSLVNSANIPGITAANVRGFFAFYITSAAQSGGSTAPADGRMTIVDGVGTPVATMGIIPNTTPFGAPVLSYGSYVQIPDWRITDAQPRPSGSVWLKTSVLGSGASIVVKRFNSANNVWSPLSVPVYSSEEEALYGLDAFGGGLNVAYGTVFAKQDPLNNNTGGYSLFVRDVQGQLVVTGKIPTTPLVFTVGDQFTIATTQPGTAVETTYTVTLGGTTSANFVSSVQAANIPYVTARLESSGAISIVHTAGGMLSFTPLTSAATPPLNTAGFTSGKSGLRLKLGTTNTLVASNFNPMIYAITIAPPYTLVEDYAASINPPYTAPADGTLWFYNNPLDVDIMVNDVNGWAGYGTVANDVRGYNLTLTDPNGPILSPIAPTSNSTGQSLELGDLWVNTGDLENFPIISRWTGSSWQLINNTDVITQNGIVFADARWDADLNSSGQSIGGQIDPAAGEFPSIAKMRLSNYVDQDCPDHRLYPRGTLLFNLRRSGFNIKHYVSNYFNSTAFPNSTIDLSTVQSATWVTSSGLQNDGSPFMGRKAQRVMVVSAMKAALDGNSSIREDSFGFNLIAAPAYPELISNMVQLNNDRKNTAFIIGDTPMTMPADVVTINNWSNDVNGTGLATADPYMAVYYPSGLSNDLSGNAIVVPPSHMILRTAIKSDNNSYPWFAFAGTRRGLIDNATDIGYVDVQSGAFVHNGINQGMRDALYPLNINAITLLPGVGLTNFGNLTRSGTTSAMDRVSVARLVNYIRTILGTVGNGFLFEPNDTITRNQIKQIVSSSLNDLIAKRGIYDYLVICDHSNNTDDRIARNELYVDIAIEPMKDVEFIFIPIRLMNPGAIASLSGQ